MKSVAFISVTLFCSVSLRAHAADSWRPSQQISDRNDAYAGSSTATDPHGDTVAVWIDAQSSTGSGPDRIKARTSIAGGALGPSSIVSVLDNADQASDVHVYMTDAGRATALWDTGSNVAFSDRPLGGHWSKARNVSYTSYSPDDHAIAADHVGDQVARLSLDVFVRRHGGNWTPVGAPVSFGHDRYFYPAGDILISASGDILDRYTVYDFHCISTHHCISSNFRNRWARLAPGQKAWTVSSDTDLSTGDAYLLDDRGRLVFATQTGSGIVVQTQPHFGGPVTTITTLPTSGKVTGFGTDAAGNATVLVAETTANQTVAFVGPLGGGATWAKQLVVVQTNLAYQQNDFKVSASGSASLVWRAGASTVEDVFAASRASNAAFWSAPAQLSVQNPAKAIDWLGIAANNQAITTWTGTARSASAGFVSIHNPQ